MSLFAGLIVETNVGSLTGKYLYSDFASGRGQKNTPLNTIVKIPVIGIAGGIARIGLGIIHTFGHLIAALVTLKKGHLYHAAKGGCEILRGTIETTPLIGRIFANTYNGIPCSDFFAINASIGNRSWWMLKIYDPAKPDGLDQWMGNWRNWPASNYVKV